MKTFYRKAIASCLSLAIIFLTIGPAAAAVANETLQIRGPVYNGSGLNDILTKNAVKMDASQFAAPDNGVLQTLDNKVTNVTP